MKTVNHVNKGKKMLLSRKSLVSLTAFLLLLTPVTLLAREGETTPPAPQAHITTEGSVKAYPDVALLNFTILTEAAKAPAASTENAQKADAFLAAVKKFLHEGDTVKSAGYSIMPLYTYGDRGRKPAISGYRASNSFQVKTKDLPRLGELIDLAAQQGVNNIQGPIWQNSHIDTLTQEASVRGLQKAEQLAEALAKSQGLKVKRLQKVSNVTRLAPFPREAVPMAAAAAPGSAATPVEVGEQEIRATIEAVFDLE
jgi:uncharacterized protein YggE